MTDYYERLGVGRNASDDEIKQAFRKGARQYHPDVSKEENAEENFKMINEAYGVLSDQSKRRAYDSTLEDRIKFETSQSNPVEGDAVSSSMRGNGWVARDDIYDSVIREAMNRGFGGSYKEGGRSDEEMWNNLADAAFPGAREMFFGRDSTRTSRKPEVGTRPPGNTRKREEKPKVINELRISDNDLALVAALKQAYSSERDANWNITREANNQRGFPPTIYRVEKRGKDIKIMRVVEDWRRDKENGGMVPKYLSEKDLADPKLRDQLKAEGINVPSGFSEYLGKLRDLALRDKSSSDMPQIVNEINQVSMRMGEYVAGISPSRENMLSFNILELNQQLTNREGQIMSIKRRMVEGMHFDPGERRV